MLLTEYQNAPGAPAEAPRMWPAESRLAPATDVPTLLLFAHPRCPCTDATLGELARLLRHAQEQVRTYVVFAQPETQDDAWTQAALWRRAQALPGVRVWRDRNARETQRFGAATSGQALLYDAGGALRFQGGITGSRGHEGANAGRTALQSILHGAPPARTETFVFGCPLSAPSRHDEAHSEAGHNCASGRCPR